MGRPTPEDLVRATGLLEELAYAHHDRNNPTCFPDVALLLEQATWLEAEVADAKRNAGWPPGTDAHTIGRHGLHRPVEQRLAWGSDRHPLRRPHLADPLYQALIRLRTSQVSQLNHLLCGPDGWTEQSRKAANWPMRTRDTG